MFTQLRRDIREMWTELRDLQRAAGHNDASRPEGQVPTDHHGIRLGGVHAGHQHDRVHADLQRVAKIETDVPYPVFSYCGLLPWNMFATTLKTGVNSLSNNRSLITKVYFPREVFPFSTMLVGVVDFVVGLSILAVLMIYFWIPLSATALFLPVLVAVQVMFTAGLCMFLAPLNLYYRDVKYVVDVLVTVWMFATPVIYPTKQVSGPLGVILQLNPLAPIIDGYRAILLRGELEAPIPFASVAVLSVVMFAVGWLVFHRAEYAFAENA